jgi:hypothetical protein
VQPCAAAAGHGTGPARNQAACYAKHQHHLMCWPPQGTATAPPKVLQPTAWLTLALTQEPAGPLTACLRHRSAVVHASTLDNFEGMLLVTWGARTHATRQVGRTCSTLVNVPRSRVSMTCHQLA